MFTTFIRFKVKDYETWKREYDKGLTLRKTYGVRAAGVYRNAKDASEVTAAQQTESLEAALAMANSDELKSRMAEAGVIGPPEIWFTEDIEQVPY